MDPKRIVALVVGAAVMVLIFSALLVPIVNDATTTEKTFTNEGLINLNKVDSTYEEVIVWDYTTPDKLTIGEDVIDLPKNAPVAVTFMANGDFFARWHYSGADGATSFIQVYTTNTTTSYNANAANSQSMTITISNGSILFDNGTSSTKTIAYTGMYCVAKEGDYVLKAPTTTAYLLDDSEVFAYGGTFTANLTFYTLIEGTPADGFDRTIWPDTLPMTYTDMADDLATVNGYVGLNTLKQFTYDITNTSTSTTRTVTYSQFIVPYEVTAELSVHPDGATLSMLSVIPIIAMVGIILAVVGVAIVGRNDY